MPHSSSGCHVNRIALVQKHEAVPAALAFFIEGEVLRSKLVGTSEVNGLYLTIEGEMILQGHDAEHACRWRKE